MKPLKQSAPRKQQVLIVDDHPLLREGLACLINRQADLAVCGEAGNARDALAAAAKLKPDIVVVDITLPGCDGLDLTKELRKRYPKRPVLILSMHDETTYAGRALRAGARGYVMKGAPVKHQIHAIRQALAGEIAVSSAIATQLARQSGHGGSQAPGKLLSARELEIFYLFGEGRNRGAIAAELNLSVKTVESHRANICRKLALRGAPEFFRCAADFVQDEIQPLAG